MTTENSATESRSVLDARSYEIIRSFRNDQELVVTYLATGQNPYRDADDIDIYDDQHGFEYWIDPVLNRLVQAGPRAGLPPGPVAQHGDVRLPVSEIRDRAVALVTAQVPDFPTRRSRFHPFEDNRRNQIFFFRWEQAGTHGFDLPPFLQVGLYADGTLACFTNTLR